MQNLSGGVIHQLMQGIGVQGPFDFQVLSMKVVTSKQANPTAPKRYRLIMSDGVHTTTMMLATQLQDMGENGMLRDGTIVRVGEIIPNDVQGRKVLIVLSIEPLGHHEGIIGSPVAYADAGGAAANAAAAQQPPLHANTNAAAPGFGQPPGPAYGQAPNPTPYGAPANFNGGQGYNAPAKGPGSFQAGPPGPNAGGGGGTGGYMGGAAPYGVPPSNPNPGAAAAPYGRAVPPPQYGGTGAVARNEAPARIMPIKSLNPFTGRWTIKGRCTSKAELRRWSNLKGEGKLFSFDLLDAGGGEIRVTAFNDQVDKFFPLIEAGGIYMVSKAGLKHKKPQFNSTNHDFEIQLERDSVIERCPDDEETRAIPEVMYNFRAISDLGSTEAGAMVDIIGVVESVDMWQTIMKKNGEETKKRSMVLRDRSGGSIEFTLWGGYANEPGDHLQTLVQSGERPVVAVKSARVGDFNGKTVSTVGSSVLRVQPDIQEARDLLTWYGAGGANERVVALSSAGGGGGGGRRCTLGSIKDEELGHGEKPDWITVPATISYIKQDNTNGQSSVVYPACNGQYNGRQCSKKMTDAGGSWQCDRCGNAVSEPDWKYLITIQASDHTGVQWLTCIGDGGNVMFDNLTAKELKALEQSNEKEFERRIWDANLNRMVFRLKVFEDTYQDERKVKTTIFKMDHMEYARECKLTLDLINKLESGVPVLIAKQADAPGAAGANANPYAQPSMQQQQPQQQRWQGGGGGGGGGMSSYAGGAGGPAGAGGYASPPGRSGGYSQQATGVYGSRPMGPAAAGPRPGTQQAPGFGGPAEGGGPGGPGGYHGAPGGGGGGYAGGHGFDNPGNNMGNMGRGGYGGGPGGPGGAAGYGGGGGGGGGNGPYGAPGAGGGYAGPGQGGPQNMGGGGGYAGGPMNGAGGGYSAPQQQGTAPYNAHSNGMGGYGGGQQQQQQQPQSKPYW